MIRISRHGGFGVRGFGYVVCGAAFLALFACISSTQLRPRLRTSHSRLQSNPLKSTNLQNKKGLGMMSFGSSRRRISSSSISSNPLVRTNWRRKTGRSVHLMSSSSSAQDDTTTSSRSSSSSSSTATEINPQDFLTKDGRVLRNPVRLSVTHNNTRTVRNYGGDVAINKYMQLPVEQYSMLNESMIIRNAANPENFVLKVPRLQFFNVWVQPRVEVSVETTEDRVGLKATNCVIEGSEVIEQMGLDSRFDFEASSEMRWTTHHHDHQQVTKQPIIIIIIIVVSRKPT